MTTRTKTLRVDGYYWIVCEGCDIDVRREHKDATLSTGQNVHEALGNRGELNGYFCGPCALIKMNEMNPLIPTPEEMDRVKVPRA